ncbi:MAG: hypothetical protein ACOCSE_05150 [Chitinivibrionales bacterium]
MTTRKVFMRLLFPVLIVGGFSLTSLYGCSNNGDIDHSDHGHPDEDGTTMHDEDGATKREEMENRNMGGHQDSLSKKGEDGELPMQNTCPVMGNPINKDLYVDHNGKRIYVCCNACITEVKKDPEKYLDKIRSMDEMPHSIPE